MSPEDDYLERVKTEIRAEADAARKRGPAPRQDPPPRGKPLPPPASGIQRDRLDYAIRELVGAHYIGFIDQAFRSILKRPPDEAGMDAQVRLLAGGASKAEILGNLRWSAEGRRIGTRVKGLPTRYLLAKAARLPVVGYFVDWAIALAGLPVLLRHQRAADTSVEARFGAAAEATRVANARLDALQAELGHRVEALGERLHQLGEDLHQLRQHLGHLQGRIDAIEPRAARHEADARATVHRIDELQHFVHANNHWVATLQRSLGEIEEMARVEREHADGLVARVIEPAAEVTARHERHALWSETLAQQLPPRARALDLGSGNGTWLAALLAQGIDASGVEPVAALARQAQARSLPVAAGEPLTALLRCADSSIDAVTLTAAALEESTVTTMTLLIEAGRALAQDGRVLVRIEREPSRMHESPAWDASRWQELLVAAGFAVARVFDADGASVVIAHRPTA